MKIALVLVCLATMAYATDQELFLSAQQLYAQKKYDAAVAAYHTMKVKGPAVWYNLGNCQYHLGQYEQARLYWQVAQCGALACVRKDVAHNTHVLAQKGYEMPFSLSEYIAYYSAQIPTLVWQLMVLFAWCMLAYLLYTSAKKRVLLMILVCLMMIGCVVLGVRYQESHRLLACVSSPGVTLFSGPDERYHRVGTLDAITTVVVDEVKDTWCKVCYKNLLGWVPIAKIELIENNT
jgi:hypothetical protein